MVGSTRKKEKKKSEQTKESFIICPKVTNIFNNYSPTHSLRPAVRGQTNRYNAKIKLGRGFTLRELRDAGIKSIGYARSIGISVDSRRKDTSSETLNLNVGRIKEYINRMVLYPRKGKYDKKAIVAEAKPETLNGPDAKFQNTHKHVIPLPAAEVGYSWSKITADMTKESAFKTLRQELKKANGFYERLEKSKKKAQK
jgi:large subunit ribosomal protein L13e